MILSLVLAAVMQFFSPDFNPEQNYRYVPLQDSTTNRFVTIDNVIVVGNKITKSDIILRELDISKGQTLSYEDLLLQLEKDEQRVVNLRLFNTVSVQPVELDDDRILIVVEVSERWYIFPVPIFDLVDRNFNVWWEQHNRDLGRVNYGLKLYQRNFRGRNEKLKVTLQFGFTRKFGLSYTIPYLDKAQRHGLIVDADYSENKNVAIGTENHIQRFYDSEDVLMASIDAGLGYTYRNAYQNIHYFRLKYKSNKVDDTVAVLNPNFFGHGRTEQQYFEASYNFVRDKRDVQAYPLKGYVLDIYLSKTGLGIYNDLNQTNLSVRYSRYIDLNKDWYVSNYSSLFLSMADEYPYYQYNAVGYRRDIIRGYELYLVEGPHFFLNKTTLKKKLLSVRETFGAIPIKQFRHFPLDVYLKTYVDWGYVDSYDNIEENNLFSDKYMVGSGMGLDIHTMYDMVIRLEYSINRERETGFFFHLKKEF